MSEECMKGYDNIVHSYGMKYIWFKLVLKQINIYIYTHVNMYFVYIIYMFRMYIYIYFKEMTMIQWTTQDYG